MIIDSVAPPFLLLLSPVAERIRRGLRPFLKLAAGASAQVVESRLTFLDAAGRAVETRLDAFGLVRGSRLVGPLGFAPNPHLFPSPPEAAVSALWDLGELGSARAELPPAGLAPAVGSRLAVAYVPFQVPLPDDVHVVIDLFHAGTTPLDLRPGAAAPRLLAGGRAFDFSPATFNGRFTAEPGRWTTLRLSLDAFRGAPRVGEHPMRVAMAGLVSDETAVTWRGAPHRG